MGRTWALSQFHQHLPSYLGQVHILKHCNATSIPSLQYGSFALAMLYITKFRPTSSTLPMLWLFLQKTSHYRCQYHCMSAWTECFHPAMFSNTQVPLRHYEMDELLPAAFHLYPNPMTWGSLKKKKTHQMTLEIAALSCLQNCSSHPYQGAKLICLQQKQKNTVKDKSG